LHQRTGEKNRLHTVPQAASEHGDAVSLADAFDGAAVRAAILGAQQGRVMYPEFKLLSQQAGCTGYTVWIAGRHVTYFGRRGRGSELEPRPVTLPPKLCGNGGSQH